MYVSNCSFKKLSYTENSSELNYWAPASIGRRMMRSGVVIYRSDQFTTITRPNQTKLSLHHFSLSPSGFVIVNIGIDLSLIPLFPLLRSECRVGLSYTIKSPGRCPILYYKLYIIILYCILLIIILYNKTSPKGTQVKGLKDTRSLNGK